MHRDHAANARPRGVVESGSNCRSCSIGCTGDCEGIGGRGPLHHHLRKGRRVELEADELPLLIERAPAHAVDADLRVNQARGQALVGESRDHHGEPLAAGHQLQHELLIPGSASCRARRLGPTPTGCPPPRSSAAGRAPAVPAAARLVRARGRRDGGSPARNCRGPSSRMTSSLVAGAYGALSPMQGHEDAGGPVLKEQHGPGRVDIGGDAGDADRVVPAGLGARHAADGVQPGQDRQCGRGPGQGGAQRVGQAQIGELAHHQPLIRHLRFSGRGRNTHALRPDRRANQRRHVQERVFLDTQFNRVLSGGHMQPEVAVPDRQLLDHTRGLEAAPVARRGRNGRQRHEVGSRRRRVPRRWTVGRVTRGRAGTSERPVHPATSMGSPAAKGWLVPLISMSERAALILDEKASPLGVGVGHDAADAHGPALAATPGQRANRRDGGQQPRRVTRGWSAASGGGGQGEQHDGPG